MSRKEKLLARILIGEVRNVRFADFAKALEACGFSHDRTSGSHQIMRHPRLAQPFPIQVTKNGTAKEYQIRQFRELYNSIKEQS